MDQYEAFRKARGENWESQEKVQRTQSLLWFTDGWDAALKEHPRGEGWDETYTNLNKLNEQQATTIKHLDARMQYWVDGYNQMRDNYNDLRKKTEQGEEDPTCYAGMTIWEWADTCTHQTTRVSTLQKQLGEMDREIEKLTAGDWETRCGRQEETITKETLQGARLRDQLEEMTRERDEWKAEHLKVRTAVAACFEDTR